MAKTIISEGKTSNEAIEKGLKELKCKLEDVTVKVLENDEKKAFFSILDPRVVKVEITVKEGTEKKDNKISEKKEERKKASKDDIEKCKKVIEKFLKSFAKAFGNIEFDIEEKDSDLFIVISGKDASKLIGYRGETIKALQNILSSIGNKETATRVRMSIDIGDYKEKREKALIELAKKLERTVVKRGKKVILEPMSAYERKIIHTALQNSKSVTTYSIGEEPKRKIVVEKK